MQGFTYTAEQARRKGADRVLIRNLRQKQGKLIPAQAREGVPLIHTPLEAPRSLAHHQVTGTMPETLVDLSEIVQPDRQNCKHSALFLGLLLQVNHRLLETVA
jgi:hypothetical protein